LKKRESVCVRDVERGREIYRKIDTCRRRDRWRQKKRELKERYRDVDREGELKGDKERGINKLRDRLSDFKREEEKRGKIDKQVERVR